MLAPRIPSLLETMARVGESHRRARVNKSFKDEVKAPPAVSADCFHAAPATSKRFHHLVGSVFLVRPTVFREETRPGKAGAIARFDEARSVPIPSAMLRVRSVAVMSASANASWIRITSDRGSRFFDCHSVVKFHC